MIPSVKEAERMLREGEKLNKGPWKEHSLAVGECARRVAGQCEGMEPEKAYILGILHDIGRRFGVTHMAHVTDGWRYLMETGYEEAARICLTHSFCDKNIESYVGNRDIPEETCIWLQAYLNEVKYDDYDLLIQLCDSIALPSGPTDLATRMNDVKSRYGYYPQAKWDRNFELKRYFEEKMGKDLYQVVKI